MFTGDGSDGGAGSGPDAASDVTVADAASSTDGGIDGADGSCIGTWCACLPTKPYFCDDFDEPGEVVGQRWNDDAGAIADPGSGIFLSDTMPQTAPKALKVSVAGAQSAVLTEDLPSLTNVLVAFDIYIPSSTCSGSPIATQLVRAVSGGTFTGNPTTYVALMHATGEDDAFISWSGGSSTVPLDLLKADQWVRVRLRVQLAMKLGWSVSYGAPGSNDTLPSSGADAGAGSVDAGPATASGGWVSVGSWNSSGMTTGSCAPSFDNIAIYQ